MQAINRARAYVAKMPAAVSGNGGHAQTFAVACSLARFGLGEEGILALLREYNQQCQPPWTERELRHKARSAIQKNAGQLIDDNLNRRQAPITQKATTEALRTHDWTFLGRGTQEDFESLSDTIEVGLPAIELASERGFLKFWNAPNTGARMWTITDSTRYVRQDRTLSGKPIRFKDGSQGKSRTIGKASWLIGADSLQGKEVVLLCEGITDFLAGWQILYATERLDDCGVCCKLGASQTIHEDAIAALQGKLVVIFPDADKAGREGAVKTHRQLKAAGISSIAYRFDGLKRMDGKPVKDLRDFLSVDADQWGSDESVRWPIPAGEEVES